MNFESANGHVDISGLHCFHSFVPHDFLTGSSCLLCINPQHIETLVALEAVIEEMKARLAMPYGHRLVSRYAEARESEAATKVQTLWRSLRAKQKLVKLMAEQKQQEATGRFDHDWSTTPRVGSTTNSPKILDILRPEGSVSELGSGFDQYILVRSIPKKIKTADTLPETNSSHLKIVHHKRKRPYSNHQFSGATFVSGRILPLQSPLNMGTSWPLADGRPGVPRSCKWLII